MKLGYSSALVTGGAGFIGSHIVDRLLENDFEVTVVDDLSTGRLENIASHQEESNFHFVKGDIRSWKTVEEAVKDVEVIFHEAAFVGVPQSVDHPLLTNDVNVNGTLNLLEAALRFGVRRFIYASSAVVYGEQETLPIKEEAIPRLNSPYAVSKLATELYAETYYRNYGLETVCLRYFNVYGPRQMYGPYAAVITAFVSHLVRGESPTIFGDGEQTRDFVNVKDVVDANMLAMEKNCAGGVFNVATGSQSTINELFRILQTLTGEKTIRSMYDKPRPFDIRRSCGDISKAKRDLGFEPKVHLEEGLSEFIKSCKPNVQDGFSR